VKTSSGHEKLIIYLCLSFWFFYFLYFWVRASEYNLGGFWLTLSNIAGDWPVHFSQGATFAYRTLFTLTAPYYILGRFTYPFLANWLTALLVRLHLNFFSAFIFTSLLFCWFFVTTLSYFFYKISKSYLSTFFALNLYLLNGGFGFLFFLKDLWQYKHLPLVILLDKEYTHLPELGIQFINIISSELLPQRTLVFGIPIALMILSGLYSWIFEQRTFRSKRKELLFLLFLGFLTGLMPLIHTHSALALAVIIGFWFIFSFGHRKGLSDWLPFLLPALLLVISIFFLFYFRNNQQLKIEWLPGWYASLYKINWLWFLFLNWGLLPLLALLGLLIERRLAIRFLPFLLLFILASLFNFQPWLWDNTKIFSWSNLAFALFAGILLARLLKRKEVLFKLLAILLFLISIFAGTLDAWRVQRVEAHRYLMYTREEIELADWLRKNTPKEAVFLTSDRINHFLPSLVGRQIVLGNRIILMSYGYNTEAVYHDVVNIYKGIDFENLVQKYKITFIVVGPFEKEDLEVNEEFLERHCQLYRATENIRIYKI